MKHKIRQLKELIDLQEQLILLLNSFLEGSLLHFLIFLYLDSDSKDEWFINERNYFIDTYGISGRHFDKSIKNLEKKQFIFKKIAKVEDRPTMHIRINTTKLLEILVFNNMQKTDVKSVKNHANTSIEHDDVITIKESNNNIKVKYVKNHKNTEFEADTNDYDAQIRKQKRLNYEKLFNSGL